LHKKNDFTEVSRNLTRYRFKNNYVRHSSIISNTAKSLNILATSLSVLIILIQQNYFQIGI